MCWVYWTNWIEICRYKWYVVFTLIWYVVVSFSHFAFKLIIQYAIELIKTFNDSKVIHCEFWHFQFCDLKTIIIPNGKCIYTQTKNNSTRLYFSIAKGWPKTIRFFVSHQKQQNTLIGQRICLEFHIKLMENQKTKNHAKTMQK